MQGAACFCVAGNHVIAQKAAALTCCGQLEHTLHVLTKRLSRRICYFLSTPSQQGAAKGWGKQVLSSALELAEQCAMSKNQ